MPTETLQIKVFVSCPGDVNNEKEVVKKACDILNRQYSGSNVYIKVVDYKTAVSPQVSVKGTQSVINEQIGEDYDLYLGIFWKRFGDIQPYNGLTPTQEEFEIALSRFRESGKPSMAVYFKSVRNEPTDSKEIEQLSLVRKFKESIRSEAYYGEFQEEEEDFLKKLLVDIDFHVKEIKRKYPFPFSKKTYPVVANYLSRKICSTKKDRMVSFLRYEESEDLLSILEKHNRIVLLSDAGAGKTTELMQIAGHFSQAQSSLTPFFMPLNEYVDEDLPELLEPAWKTIPENHLLLLLDGLDEIQSKNRNDGIRKIESFSRQYPNSKIIVSCRANFYKAEKEEESGTLSGFSSFMLLDLDNKDIETYIQTQLSSQAESFKNVISLNRLQALLRIPFYLVRLVTLFGTNKKLPKSKAGIFEQLLNDRIKLDLNHYRTTIELDENLRKIRATLERLALGLEMLGKNYLTENEYEKIVPDMSLRTMTKHCSTWKKNEGELVTWQFEHNNFQEYLAAKVLSSKPLQVVKDVISFKADYRKVIPSWINTLAFLLNISNNPSLTDWILEIEPEIAVRIEPNRIEDSIRIGIFKRIFRKYKEKNIWIPFDKFDYYDLARFGQSNEITLFLLNEVESATHFTTRCNAIELLGYTDIQSSCRQRATQVLAKYALEKSTGQKRQDEQVQAQALIALARTGLNSRKIVNQIVHVLSSSDSSYVRFGLYYFIHQSECLNEYIDVFLEGIPYVRFSASTTSGSAISNSRFAEEQWNIKVGLEKINSPEAIRKILTYFKQNPRDLEGTSLSSSLSTIAENAAVAYNSEPNILESAVDLVSVLANEYLKEEVHYFVRFFDKTNTRLQTFQKVFEQRIENDHAMDTLSVMVNQECLEFFVEQYEKGRIVDKDVWWFQNLLGLNNPDLFLPFNELINKKSGNKFLLPPRRDFEKERTIRRAQDINLLFNKTDFLKQIKLVFEKEQKQTFTSDEVLKVWTSHRLDDQYYSDLAINTLLHITKKHPASFEDVTKIVDKCNWDWFCISEVYRRFESDKELLTTEQKNWISQWCYSNLGKVDFKKAVAKNPDNQTSASNLAIYLWYFLRKLDLKYHNNVLLDMLSFDWIEGHQMAGTIYLEEELNKADVTERILKNLDYGIQIDDVLKNHFDYCRRNKITACLPFALRELSNTNRSYDARKSALDAILETSQTMTDLEQILPKISDDFKWTVIGQLVKHNSEYVQTFLRAILESGSEQEKLKAAEFLISLKDLTGLKYYVEWVRKNKKISGGLLERSPIESIQIPEAIPNLIKLLETSYDKALIDSFPSLYSVVVNTLTAIALQSESNYAKVKETIEHFVKENFAKIEGVNFLNSYLEDLERSYYLRKSEKLDINEIVKRLDVLCS
jgi:predicted NACHT family NTPase